MDLGRRAWCGPDSDPAMPAGRSMSLSAAPGDEIPMDDIKTFLWKKAKSTEFDVGAGDFSVLQIQQGGDDPSFFYFYDTQASRLIKSFVLDERPQVETICDVKLIKSDDGFSPRLRLWKKDKTKGTPEVLTEDELIAEGRTLLIKARVALDDCHVNFWKLIDFLRSFKDIDLPDYDFRVASKEDIELAAALDGHDKDAVLSAVKTYLGGNVSERDVQMLLDRRESLERFEKLLGDPAFFEAEREKKADGKAGGGEAVWQAFFEANPWIFGYGLTLLACEKYSEKKLEVITTGRNVFSGGGKRIDAAMRTRGFVQTLLFAEIKRHDTDLLKNSAYRPPDVYQVSDELSGAVSQIQKTTHKAVKDLLDLHRQNTESGEYQFDVLTIWPRQVIVIGNLEQLSDNGTVNEEKTTSFELYRRDHQGVEILTFDELYQRARFIVESQEIEPSITTDDPTPG
jgi:hypothetical protein